MSHTYSLLKKVFDHYQREKRAVADIFLVCCQHILEPQAKMFELLVVFGFDPNKIIILGKAYSTNQEVFHKIKRGGIRVFQPPFSGRFFDEEHRNNCKMIVGLVPPKAECIVLDDGAELIKAFADSDRKVIFAVEQTSSGFRKLENEPPLFPVFNVARSTTKLVQESPLIARLCFERISEYLLDHQVHNPSVLVVGLGPVGEAILEIFIQNHFVAQGFDIKDGGNDDLKLSITKQKPNVIVGATGCNILTKTDIDSLGSDKPVFLISVSSSDREFPIGPFRNDNKIHRDVIYKNIVFVNNGFPITFKGNANELTPAEIEKTICLLGGSILDGIVNGVTKSGLINIPESLEKLIN